MAIETEVKIKVDDGTFCQIMSDRRKKGMPLKFSLQQNIIYDTGNGGFMRIRREHGRITFTAKGKSDGRAISSREEIETLMEDNSSEFFDNLRRLSSGKAVYYEKNRANCYFDDCTISLDEFPRGSAHYVEIEGPKNQIKKYIRELGLSRMPVEKRSYFEILRAKNE